MSMIDFERIRNVEDSIIDTLTDATTWPNIIEDLRIATGSFGVNITPGRGHNESLLCSPSIDHCLEFYFSEAWNERDYRIRGLHLLRSQRVFIDSDFMTEDDYSDEYFRFTRQYKAIYGAVIGFKSGDEVLCASLHRTLGSQPFSQAEKAALLGVSDRLTMACSIGNALADAKLDGLSAGFDMMRIPVMLFDRFGRLVRLNAAAERLLGPDLSIVKGEVRTRIPAEGVKLRQLIHETYSGMAQAGAAARVTRQCNRPLVFRFQPLGGHTRDFFTKAQVMGVITDLEDKSTSQADVLRAVFNLSAAETQVALLLAQGETLRSISDLRGISYETTRSHMKAIFQKTEVKRQSELVSLFKNIR